MKCGSSLSKYPPHPHMRPNSNRRGDHLLARSSITPASDFVKANTFICIIPRWFSLCIQGDTPHNTLKFPSSTKQYTVGIFIGHFKAFCLLVAT